MHDEQQALPAILLSPRGPYRPGDSVTAAWSMTNFADHELAGARLVFNVPPSLAPVLESSTLQGRRGDALAAAFTRDGFDLGTVRPGDSIAAALALSVLAGDVEPGSLSVALRLEDGETFVSQRIEIGVRARALVTLPAAPHACEIDAQARRVCVAFTLRNAGEAVAERPDLTVPAPDGFVVSRVRLPGGSAVAPGNEPFRLPDIACGATLDVILEFESRTGELAGHVEIDGIRLAYEGGRLFIDPIAVPLDGALDLTPAGELTTPSSTVEPGSVIRLDLAIRNAARADLPGVTAAFALPPELTFCSGTIAVNGGCDERRNDPASIGVGTVLGRSSSLVSLYAALSAPLEHERTIAVGASVNGVPVEPLELTVTSCPSFPASPHAFELEGPAVLGAGERRTVRLRAANAGTADAHAVRARLISASLTAERAEVVYSSGAREPIALKSTVTRDGVACAAIDLGTVSARDIKTLEVEVRAPDHFTDGEGFTLAADLRYAGGSEVSLGSLSLAGRCRPSIDPHESGLRALRDEPLRVGQVRAYSLRIKNAGLAAARGVSVSLNLPGMLAVEAVNGEPASDDVVVIREIAAGAAVEIPVALRLLESVDGGATIAIAPVVSGSGISTMPLALVSVPTVGQAFLDEFDTAVEARDADVLASLRFRNVGDAVAQQVVVAALDLPAAYVPESTRLGGVAVPDYGGTSLLARGITLPPLPPGRELAVSYRLAAAAAVGSRVAFIVRSRSQDEILTEPVVYGMPASKEPATSVPPASTPGPARVSPSGDLPRYDVRPAHEFATASPSGNGHAAHAVATAVAPAPTQTHGLTGYVVLAGDELERVRRVAEAALGLPALGTYRHLFALRAFVPRELLGASDAVAAAWGRVHDRVRADLRGPFMEAVLPGFEASPEWAAAFYDASSGEAAATAIGAVRLAAEENVPYDDVPAPADQVRGAFGNEFEGYLSSIPEPNGDLLNLILAEALPTESPRDPELSKALKKYRERLKLLFAALLYQNASARHERMRSGLDVELDDTLRVIVDRLRDPSWA
jgi:uncharacterized repeat protein (TIGR01451 family)